MIREQLYVKYTVHENHYKGNLRSSLPFLTCYYIFVEIKILQKIKPISYTHEMYVWITLPSKGKHHVKKQPVSACFNNCQYGVGICSNSIIVLLL